MTHTSTLLTGGTLVDVTTGTTMPDTSILIEGDRITAVGRASDITAPADADAIDAGGAWIMPGLTDMHVHTGGNWDTLPLYLAAGVTTVRDVGGNLTELRLMRDDVAADRRIGPRVFLAGPLLDGFPPLWPPNTILVDTPERARSAARFLIDQGVDLLKVYNSVPETSLKVIVEEATAAGLPVAGHIPRALTMTRAVEIGMSCLEHIRVTGRELLPADEAARIDFLPLVERESLLWDRFDLEMPAMHRLIALLAEREVFLDPTMIVDAGTFGPYADERELGPMDKQLPPDVLAAMQEHDMRGAPVFRVPEHLREKAAAGFEKRLGFVRMCHEAGVRVLAGTDTIGVGKLLPGPSLHEELDLLVRAGLTPLDALRAATTTAATALRQEANMGSIAPGKLADVVILDGDPLADISAVRRIRSVIKAGHSFAPAELLANSGKS